MEAVAARTIDALRAARAELARSEWRVLEPVVTECRLFCSEWQRCKARQETPTTKLFSLPSLPQEILERILAFCYSDSLHCLRCSCKMFDAPLGRGRSLFRRGLYDAAVRSFGPALGIFAYGQNLPGPEARLCCLEQAKRGVPTILEIAADEEPDELGKCIRESARNPGQLFDLGFHSLNDHTYGHYDDVQRGETWYETSSLMLLGTLVELVRLDRSLAADALQAFQELALSFDTAYLWQGCRAGLVGMVILLQEDVPEGMSWELRFSLLQTLHEVLGGKARWDDRGTCEPPTANTVLGWAWAVNLEECLVELIGSIDLRAINDPEQRSCACRCGVLALQCVSLSVRDATRSPLRDGQASRLLPRIMTFVRYKGVQDEANLPTKPWSDARETVLQLLTTLLGSGNERYQEFIPEKELAQGPCLWGCEPSPHDAANRLTVSESCLPFLLRAVDDPENVDDAVTILHSVSACGSSLMHAGMDVRLCQLLSESPPKLFELSCLAASALIRIVEAAETPQPDGTHPAWRGRLYKRLRQAGVEEHFERMFVERGARVAQQEREERERLQRLAAEMAADAELGDQQRRSMLHHRLPSYSARDKWGDRGHSPMLGFIWPNHDWRLPKNLDHAVDRWARCLEWLRCEVGADPRAP